MDASMANDLRIVRAYLEVCWDKKTAYPYKDNLWGTKSRGQCYVTALLINKLFGGEVMHGYIKIDTKKAVETGGDYIEEHHFWNRLPDGTEIDLTGDQYGGDGKTPVYAYGEVYSKPRFTNKRYLLLVERYQSAGGLLGITKL